MKNSLIFLVLFIQLARTQIQAQVVDDPTSKPSAGHEISELTKAKLLTELKELAKKPEAEIEEILQRFNNEVFYYVQQRDEECQGEFSSIEINDKGESEVVKRTLSKTERKLCLIDLVNFRKTYINEVFKIRKKILLNSHAKQLKELEDIRRSSIKKMDDLVSDLTK